MQRRPSRFVLRTTVASLAAVCAVSAPGLGAMEGERSNLANRHIVVVVWDGMRPDFVSEQNTPVLWKLAQGGVIFRNHHSVYPSATIVNGTAINTGDYPDHSGVLANHDYFPMIDAKRSIDVENARVVKKGDAVSSGKYVRVPTLAEIIRERGGRTTIAAAKTVGLLFDRHCDSGHCADVFAGESIPRDAVSSIVKKFGPFPSANQPVNRDLWTTGALTHVLWAKEVPAFSLLWLSEPDDHEHKTAPGDPIPMAAMKLTDLDLDHVLDGLDHYKIRESTDIFVVSDHGFSTIERSIDVPKILRDAGFDAVNEFASEPKPGQIMLVGNGGTVLFYVIGHDPAITRKLVEFLQQTDFAGVIFTRDQIEGTFTLDKARIDRDTGPDVVMAFRWNENKNQFGAPGMIDADWLRAAGKGTHATLSRFDMHNTLIAAGPDFQSGLTSELPSGNVDLAPTILEILGIKPPSKMDGRILSEGMRSRQTPKAEAQTIGAAKKFPNGTWRQHLTISRVGETSYIDEGNGGFER